MNRTLIAAIALLALGSFAGIAAGKEEDKGSAARGAELFKKHCTSCHPDGGNIMNPGKTLKKSDLDAHKVRNAADVVKLMRNPGPGMTRFDTEAIPDREAREIAEYVMKTFK